MTKAHGPLPAPASSADMWGRYWRAGPLHSCACAFSGNYQGATAAFWERQFALLPDDSVVVDVGTGNGAIPLLASRTDDELLLQRFRQLGFAHCALAQLEHAPGFLLGWTMSVERRDE